MNPLAVYIHIPFCTVKCGYCDFNAYAGLDDQKTDYVQALKVELEQWGRVLGTRPVTSVFFGGGTPGELPAESLASILSSVQRAFAVEGDCEISVEVNPGTTNPAAMSALRTAGVTRLSIGAQRFEANELRFLDRIHSPEAAEASVRAALATGFDSVSVDLMYGLPGETPEDWDRTVERAIALGPQHISTYALTVEEGTPLALRVARGQVTAADPDLVAEMYDRGRGQLCAAGYEHYEVSNFARPGHRSRHNQVYWHGGEYLGTGAGAHGFIGGVRYENRAHPVRYLRSVRRWRQAVTDAYRPNEPMRIADWLEARLRMLDGFSLVEFEAFSGRPFAELLGAVAEELRQGGVLQVEDGIVRLSERGLQLHSEVTVLFLVELERTLGPSGKLPVERPFAEAIAAP